MADLKGKILIADDEPAIRRILMTTFRKFGLDMIEAVDGEDALAKTREHQPDLVILDVMMPKLDGLEVCRRMRTDTALKRIPIMFLSARDRENDILEGFETGGDEYITKPFSPSQLLARATAMMRRTAEDRDSNPLTGLPGNNAIERHIQGRINKDELFALVYADLDHFKGYNDVYGYDNGDEAIRELAASLTDTARALAGPPPFVGHVGGDDFIIALEDAQAETYAEAVLADFAPRVAPLYSQEDRDRGTILADDRRGIQVEFPLITLSLGVTYTSRHPGAPYAELAAFATECKKKAKMQVGNSWYADQRVTDTTPKRQPSGKEEISEQ